MCITFLNNSINFFTDCNFWENKFGESTLYWGNLKICSVKNKTFQKPVQFSLFKSCMYEKHIHLNLVQYCLKLVVMLVLSYSLPWSYLTSNYILYRNICIILGCRGGKDVCLSVNCFSLDKIVYQNAWFLTKYIRNI